MPIPAWWEVEVEVPGAAGEDFAGLLIEGGALGVELGASPNAGFERLTVSYDGAQNEPDLADAVHGAATELGVPLSRAPVMRRRDDSDWAEKWKEHFAPLQLGERLWIVPSWIDGFVPPRDACIIRMDPGMAFGTGQHATTALTWELIERDVLLLDETARAHASLLDVGCGTGILAMGAAALGVRRVVAIDNDPIAVDVTRDNAHKNAMQQVLTASEAPLADISGSFSHVAANILAPTLIELADALVHHVAPGGHLYVSGVLATEGDEVVRGLTAAVDAAGRRDLLLGETRRRGDWVALAWGPG